MHYSLDKIRADFPILSREVYGRPLVYLDNAATTQKPLQVLDAMREEYLNVNANVHRGVHYLSQQATDLHEAARETVRRFINARSTEEIVFTRGTTEAINLVASSFCQWLTEETRRKPQCPAVFPQGEESCLEILVTDMEHHSNIVPWQLEAKRRNLQSPPAECGTRNPEFVIRHLPISDDGRLPEGDELDSYFTENTRLLSLTHVSNVLGTVNPVKEIIRKAHEHGVPVLVDAAQSAPHLRLDVQDLDCDFLAFSGHKMYGPTGIGVLYGKEEWLDRLPPYQGGGEMIDHVSWDKTTFERPPLKFEAGTPDYIATHGLAKAIEYMEAIGLDNIERHEHDLTCYCLEQMQTIPDIRIFGPNGQRSKVGGGPVSFLVGDIHHLDMGTLLDRLGIAVRTGHHCAQPLMNRLGITGTVRASFALYNTKEEIDHLVEGINRISKMF